MDTVRVSLAPSPGFCVKSTALQAAVCKVTPPPPASPSENRLDGPSFLPTTITIPKGLKVFVNIAWDRHVPPPPEGSEDAIQKAMIGEEEPDERNSQGWFVPVVVSEPREDHDKAGKPSAVFDCVYNSTLKSRALKDPEFKTFLIELAFQRIEAQHSVLLSRQIGTPNIRAKGELQPRTVLIPAALFDEKDQVKTLPETNGAKATKKLIEEVPTSASSPSEQSGDKPKGILKHSDAPVATLEESASLPQPDFSWSKGEDGLKLYIKVPQLTHAHVPSATLDVEPRRLILRVPALYELDLDLSLSDAQIRDHRQLSKPAIEQALMLKRQKDFDVDHARAEWRVAEGRLVVHV